MPKSVVMARRGVALILVTGVLALLAMLGTAFVTMAQLERRASRQRFQSTLAALAARSGLEDALARLAAGQDPVYGGEDFDGDGALGPGVETSEQLYLPGALNVQDCPLRYALRPSYFARGGPGQPDLKDVESRRRGYSGTLGEARYALKVEDLNNRIHVNGGSLAAVDPDPDGPNAPPEVAPLAANGILDFHDPSPEGPNGFLRRLLDNLELVVTGTNASPSLGEEILQARPLGGYRRLEDLKPVLGQARYDPFRAFLTVQAWVDPKVARPQPANFRPQRFLDIDSVHRLGRPVNNPSLCGIPTSTPIAGRGLPGNPWTQAITLTNALEGSRTYPVAWERDFIYAHKQLRLAPPALEPRAPLALNTASREVLAAALTGLRGTYLEVWDGAAGWDGGLGWCSVPNYNAPPTLPGQYPYPDQATEETPWHRTRADYGAPYGTASRPWYGPTTIDPTQYPSGSGMSLVGSAALGRLTVTSDISVSQALAVADQVRARVSQKGPFRAWAEFNAFVDGLPRWEDMNADGLLDGVGAPGIPYLVTGYDLTAPSGVNPDITYARRRYEREDANSDGVMNREVFTVASGSWTNGNIAFVDRGTAALGAGQVPGLTFVQKDVLKAMANPNTDLNDFNPDANLFKEVDKTDIGGTGSVNLSGAFQPDPDAYAHTTEFTLDQAGVFAVAAVGRRVSPSGRLLAERALGIAVRTLEIHRDTTQADFMRDFTGGQPIGRVFMPPAALSYPLAGAQALLSYPEPQVLPGGGLAGNAAYDGQVGLGLLGAMTPAAPVNPSDEKLRGDFFLDLDATPTGDPSTPDQRGPFHAALVAPAAQAVGNLFPDGLYSEKDAALKLPMAGNFQQSDVFDPFNPDPGTYVFYLSCWVKPNWFPEASPRPHALVSMSPYHKERGGGLMGAYKQWNPYGLPVDISPLDKIPSQPVGCYFVPARNNLVQDSMSVTTYVHDTVSARGASWPCRSLLWGTLHSLNPSITLNVRGMPTQAKGNWMPPAATLPVAVKPVGRLQAHRWVHLGLIAKTFYNCYPSAPVTYLILGRKNTGPGVGHSYGFGFIQDAIEFTHDEPGGTSPNHLRFGEIAAENNMNWTADATFGNVRQGGAFTSYNQYQGTINSYLFHMGLTTSPGVIGRYLKESEAVFVSPRLPAAASRPVRITWTEIPCDLWFDKDGDGWLGDAADAHLPLNDQFGPGGSGGPDGLPDVRIDLELWDDRGPSGPVGDVSLLGYDALGMPNRLSDPAGPNRVPIPQGKIYYKAVFVNDWDPGTRFNHPLDVTPFLDDVTVTYRPAGGPVILAWDPAFAD